MPTLVCYQLSQDEECVMPDIDTSAMRAFESPQAFADWLSAHHDNTPELWLKMYKKGSGVPSINWQEAVIEALCWGWIDGVKKSWDEQAFVQRFTPRRTKSQWSQINCEHVQRLMKEGRMQASGLAQVEAAKADGRWDKAYAPASQMKVPDDFLAALKARPKAFAFFQSLNKANHYAIGYQLSTAKKEETRQRRFEKLLNKMESQERLH